jgi:hypothetical protein
MENILEAIKKASIEIKHLIEMGDTGKSTNQNSTGDTQLKLDIASDVIIENHFKKLSNADIHPIIDKKDDILKFQKTGGAIDKAVATGGVGVSAGGTTNIHISFDEIKVTSDGSSAKIDLEKDTAFINQLASKIKESLSKTANGGVLSPNPST